MQTITPDSPKNCKRYPVLIGWTMAIVIQGDGWRS